MQIGVIEIKNKGYRIFKSEDNDYYIEESFYVDYQIPDPMTFASRFGNLAKAAIPTFIVEEQFYSFLKVIKSINNLNIKFIDALRKLNVLGQFVSNLIYCIPDSFNDAEFGVILRGLFVWNNTVEGQDFWQDVHGALKFIEKHENQLQNEDIDRSGDNRSEGNRICCRRDKSESSTGHSSYQACARKRKHASRNHKVYLSSRRGSIYRS